ncbi:DUF6233 domain-containing protein [Streptomyces sp. NPDC058394]|uniref:DUF6233 domain-containing protein n=1 Tax=unclassified Streptomyces TaxID=2593676 RepID=UPI003657AB16
MRSQGFRHVVGQRHIPRLTALARVVRHSTSGRQSSSPWTSWTQPFWPELASLSSSRPPSCEASSGCRQRTSASGSVCTGSPEHPTPCAAGTACSSSSATTCSVRQPQPNPPPGTRANARALAALADGIRACIHCRPDTELGVL